MPPIVGDGDVTESPVSSVLVYSNSAAVRESVMFAVGKRPAPDVGRVRFLEAATEFEVLEVADSGTADVLILDGEAQPTGGMGLSRQLKYELPACPPIVVLIARRDDRWLATWSLADAVIARPVDPVSAAETVAEVLRARAVV
jgi:DNA-binding NarL/FixJ family response regulator